MLSTESQSSTTIPKNRVRASFCLLYTSKRSKRIEEGQDRCRLIHQERYHGSYTRSFFVGEELEQEDIKASFHNGILKLTVPKHVTRKIEDTKKYIAIE